MKTLFLTFLSFMLLSCSNSNDGFTPQTIMPILIGKGTLQGVEGINPQNSVIDNNVAWNNILNLIDDNRIQLYFTTTNVDFSTHKLICVFDNVYPNPSHEIEISNIIENENNIVVTIQSNYTPMVSSTLEQPFHIVKIPKSIKPVVFQ